MSYLSRILVSFVLLVFVSCDKKERDSNAVKFNDIFGEWNVTHAEFIRGEKFLYNESLDDNSLEASKKSYVYRFKSDSTFERGKPNYKHGNVEEAHGRFSVSKDKKVMKWYLHWDSQERVDTTEIQIIAMTPIKIVINESNGAHCILQILERADSAKK
jgi:hypothetical protein